MVACVGRLLPDHAWLGAWFAPFRVWVAAALRRPAVLLRGQSQWPAQANARHARPRVCAPFLRARIRPLASMAKGLCVRLRVPVRVFLFLAYQDCFALSSIFGRNENYAVCIAARLPGFT